MPERSKGKNPYASPVQRNHQSDGQAPSATNQFVFGGYGAYAVRQIPESTDPEWTTGFSSALKAGGSPDGSALPDDIRVGLREPPPNGAGNNPEWNAVRSSEKLKRHTVEHTTTTWKVQQHRVPPPKMPIWEQDRPPTRPTANNSPISHLFQRPEHRPRPITEAIGPDAVTHFSLADHRRVYRIMGQKPQGRLGVNTYRAEPRPWDEELFIPPAAGQDFSGIAGNRAHRLA